MRKIIETFIRYPFYSKIIIFVIFIGGLISVSNMKLSFFPEISSRVIRVQVTYPGASPQEMEEGVTALIEEAVRGLVGIKDFYSQSSENYAGVTIEITGSADIDEVLMDVKNAVDGITNFPSAAERPIVFKVRNTTHAAKLALSGDVDLITLTNFANRIEEELMNTGVISQVSIKNEPTIQIAIDIQEENLLKYNLTFDEVTRAVQANNRDLSGGELKTGEQEILIRLRSRSLDVEKIKNIVIRGGAQGSIVKVKDVAVVKKTINEDYHPTVLNGKNAITFDISKLNNEDLKAITETLEKYTEEFNETHKTVQLKITRKHIDILNQRLDLVITNGIQGLILVIITLGLFLNLRLSFWVAWGIPSAFLAMFIVAGLMGITINMISLFGMILVIGILVDDGIVIGENIFTHHEMGKTPARAAIDGTMEVLPAVITSVTTTIVAFTPLLFLIGGRMEMMVEMAIIVILCLTFSLLEAFFVLPIHLTSKKVLKGSSEGNTNKGIRKYVDKGFNYLRDNLYHKYINWALRWRYVVLIGGIAFFVLLTIGLFRGGIIETTIFPNVENDDFSVNFAYSPGNGSEKTYKTLEKVEQAVIEVNKEFTEKYKDKIIEKNDTLLQIIDYYTLRVGYAFSGEEIGSHAGMVEVYPIELEGLGITAQDISSAVEKKLGKMPEVKKVTIGAANRWGAPISLSVMGRNLNQIDGAKDMLLEELFTFSELKDVKENNPLGKQEILIKLKDKAYNLGLSEFAIANQVRQGFYGEQIQRIQEGRNEVRIWVRYPENDRRFVGQLENMKIKTAQGNIPFSELCEYSIERGPVSINHLNGRREIRVEADLKDKEMSVTNMIDRISVEVLPKIKAKYPDVYLEFQGQAKFGKEVGNSIAGGFQLAFAIIFLILILHFRSVEDAFLIILMIPLGLMGAAWGHAIHGKDMSLMSMQGAIALSGVVINDAVVFLSRYKDLIKEGYSVWDAIVLAGKSRLRAILLTSITTCAGLMPLIAETSFQAQFLIPMAISLSYGVLFGTIFILMLFPVLILVNNDIRRFFFSLKKNKSLTREDVDLVILQQIKDKELYEK